MKVAVVGATGLVGSMMTRILEERDFPVSELIPVSSGQSQGREIVFRGGKIAVTDCETAVRKKPALALLSAGGSVSLEWAPRFAEAGTTVIDNSSAWRMDPDKKLVVPEINAGVLTAEDRIIANPNCSTIQMVMALYPLHRRYGIKRVVVATYQSVSGSGRRAVEQLMNERKGRDDAEKFYPHRIDLNLLPQVDVFLDNGYTKEEMKMVNETRKILGDESIAVTATSVRVPVTGGHSESVNVELGKDYDLEEARRLLQEMPGVVLIDEPAQHHYPMPLMAEGKDDVFVGRIRRDESHPRALNMWIVSDNLRKGAATNAVQIAEWLVEKGILRPEARSAVR